MNKKETISIEYKKPIHLFRDDLLAIESILKQDLSGSNLKITFDNFDSENISSIPIDQKLSNNISFHIYKPYFSVEVRRFSSEFYAAEDSLQVRGAIDKIGEIFDSAVLRSVKVRRWISRSMYGLSIFSGVFLGAALLGDAEILKEVLSSSKIISFMFVALPFLCLFSWSQMTWPLKPIIEFEMRNNRKNFWERNKEQIYVGLIVGVPVAIVSFVLGILTGRT